MPISVLVRADFTPKPFAEAARQFAKKAPLTSDEFERLAVRHRHAAFRVLEVHKARLIQSVRDMLERAVRDGTDFREFRNAVAALFDRDGLPAPALRHLQLAFRQDTQQAYNDARAELLDKVADDFPYRMYWTVGNGTAGINNVRPEHAALHGKVFKWNDPFWRRFTPPWEFGCRCTFVALTASMVRARGVTVWTYRGGLVTPAARDPAGTKRGAKPFALATNPRFKRVVGAVDLRGLDADLRRLLEERLK